MAAGRKAAVASSQPSVRGHCVGVTAVRSPAGSSNLLCTGAQPQLRARSTSHVSPVRTQPSRASQPGRAASSRPSWGSAQKGDSRPAASRSSWGAPPAVTGKPERQVHGTSAVSRDEALGQHFAKPSRIARPASSHGAGIRGAAATRSAGASSTDSASCGAGARGVRASTAGPSRNSRSTAAAEARKIPRPPLDTQGQHSEVRTCQTLHAFMLHRAACVG